MEKTFTKLFHKILSSSIWDEDDKTRIVWITLLAMTDEEGVIIATMKKISRDARVDLPSCEAAMAKFLGPDPESTSPEYEGRRLEPVAGGWKMLNYAKYREQMNLEARRAYYRKKKRDAREQERALNEGKTMRVIVQERMDAQVEADKIDRKEKLEQEDLPPHLQ